jgi:hypothetical protein
MTADLKEPRYFHICVNVREMLARPDDVLLDLYRCDIERLAGIRTRMVMALMQGHDYMPLHGVCSNFDPAQGCLGHTLNDAKTFSSGEI